MHYKFSKSITTDTSTQPQRAIYCCVARGEPDTVFTVQNRTEICLECALILQFRTNSQCLHCTCYNNKEIFSF
uniref:AlNc14C12G1429 protein n=1 Tax=Albugo laibachii Nc14 TaxID=890382 RepID=F0W351_9STRA|nr:AlNc14C12G1429 [Albugo laibachii Nc14]|eukprot:CCA15491.1 AlNc14C12G1429 [Albugo laibachii Nc14]